MELQKINVKFFTVRADEPPLTDFIGVFHDWIQASEGVYHDIADYSHMQAGPGIVLVAHEADVSIDETENRRGLLYSQKAPVQGSNPERLKHVLRAALENTLRLERHPILRGKAGFSGDELWLSINDRLLASNNDESFDTMKTEIEPTARSLFRGADLVFDRDRDPRTRLNLRVKASRSYALDELLRNLQDA